MPLLGSGTLVSLQACTVPVCLPTAVPYILVLLYRTGPTAVLTYAFPTYSVPHFDFHFIFDTVEKWWGEEYPPSNEGPCFGANNETFAKWVARSGSRTDAYRLARTYQYSCRTVGWGRDYVRGL